MAVSQNIKPRSTPWTHRPIHTPDPYQNAGDPDRSIRLDHRGPIHTRILTQPHIYIISYIYISYIYIYIYVLIYLWYIYILYSLLVGSNSRPSTVDSARCMLSFRRCAPCSGPRCCSSWSTTCASEIEGLRDGPFLGKFWENSARSEMTRMTEFTGENGTFTFGGLFSMYKKDKKQRIRGLEPWLKFLAKPALWVQIPKIWATEVEEFWGFAAPKVDSHRSGGWDFESLSWKLAEYWLKIGTCHELSWKILSL